MQIIYQIISVYFEDDCADEPMLDPVFNAILEKSCLASQPTLSRFFNRMDEDTLTQFDDIDKSLRDVIYSIKYPEHMLLDLDSTLFGTYGDQEGEGFNFHYQAHGYHPADVGTTEQSDPHIHILGCRETPLRIGQRETWR